MESIERPMVVMREVWMMTVFFFFLNPYMT